MRFLLLVTLCVTACAHSAPSRLKITDNLSPALQTLQGAELNAVAAFKAGAPRELQSVAGRVQAQFSRTPPVEVVFDVLYDNAPLKEESGRVVFNARSSAWREPGARKVAFARVLFAALHNEHQSESLGPLATEVWRDGAARIAVRRLVPEATEEQVLGLSSDQLEQLKQRESLIAKEVLAAWDSASDEAAERFFGRGDPLLPPGSGKFIADRLYVRLGSSNRSLFVPASDFTRTARQTLQAMASTR
ncbi:MAG: hypothetical protein ACT4TC_03025 [Myxococcaceae bacterium]